MIKDNDGEMIVKIDINVGGGFDLMPDDAAFGWFVTERDYHRYITAKSALFLATSQLLSMRKPE